MPDMELNPLLSSGQASESSLTVQLHPLVLLTISDYVTRHSLRRLEGPIVGAIIGQQNGREVTMEHAFECKLRLDSTSDGQQRVFVDEEWFSERLEQFKDVHKAPALDLVALFTLGPATGPLPEHIPILQQLQHNYNDSLVLLLFHPETILNGALTGGKLPISLYESYYEPGSEDAHKGLQVEGFGMGTQLQMRFRTLGFEVETGEAEMISVDFVAKGAGNASAIASAGATQTTKNDTAAAAKAKGKDRETDAGAENAATSEGVLSSEDEELIASLTSKSNAIKMLHQRIGLIQSYLSSLPPSYLSDPSIPVSSPNGAEQINHTLLRNVSALLSRLPLLSPPTASSSSVSATDPIPAPNTVTSLSRASVQEQSDVHLVSLLSSLTRTISDARDFGGKYSVVTRARQDGKMRSMLKGDGSGVGAGFSRRGGDWPGEGDPDGMMMP